MNNKLTTYELHKVFIDSLSSAVYSHSDLNEKPLLVTLNPPHCMKLKVYLFNCTNPPGARQAGECKSQLILPGQQRGERGHFELDPEYKTLLVGFCTVTEDIQDGSYVLWDLKKHMEFAYSASVQVALSTLLRSYTEPVFCMKKRGNGEWIVVCQRTYLLEAIYMRMNKDIDLLLEG